MHDPVEIRRRIERLVARVERRDDYAKLLVDGEVVRDLAQLGRPVEDWRAELRRQARADRIPIRTGTSATCTWAVISRPTSDEELDEAHRRVAQIERASRVALDLDHDPVVVLADGYESLLRCHACAADGFTDATGPGVTVGELFERVCLGEPSGS